MKDILNKINICLILLLVISLIFSSYGIYSVANVKKNTASINNENIKTQISEMYNIIFILIIFLFSLFSISIITIIVRLRRYVEIKESAMFDHLTKLYNRHYFTKRFEEEIERSKRFKHPLSVLMLDLDDFKKYNDKYGHGKGDTLLKTVAEIMTSSVRKIDVIGRWGGEEFLVLLPETKGRDAYIVAERMRTNIHHSTNSTVSIGLIFYRYYYPDAKEIIDKVDKLMYKAKQAGKNKICYK